MKKWLTISLLLALLGGAAAFHVVRGGESEVVRDPDAGTAEVSRRSLEVVVEAAGLVEPVRVIEVKSRASGEVRSVLVETGMFVRRGTLLSEIDPRDVENAYQQAVADLESATVRWDIADAQRQRMVALKDSDVITVQELESAVQSAASARAELVRARTNLQLARERRGDVTIRAPDDGTIIERTVEPGQIIASAISNVSGGTTLFRMADLSSMQVRANVDETDIAQVKPGQDVRVTVDAWPGRAFAGRVLKVEPLAVVEQNVTTFPVLVTLANPDGLLKPGMNAEITIEVDRREDALAVPNGAVVGMRDVRAAAAALGLDPEAVRDSLRGRPDGATPSPKKESPNDGSPKAVSEKGEGGEVPVEGAVAAVRAADSAVVDCDALQKRVVDEGFAALSQTERASLRECRPDSGANPVGSTRPAVVFVRAEGGKPEPRRVLVGLSDWEHSEVIRGLDGSERVMLVSVAQLQKAQAEQQERFRQRVGGSMMPGMRRR